MRTCGYASAHEHSKSIESQLSLEKKLINSYKKQRSYKTMKMHMKFEKKDLVYVPAWEIPFLAYDCIPLENIQVNKVSV